MFGYVPRSILSSIPFGHDLVSRCIPVKNVVWPLCAMSARRMPSSGIFVVSLLSNYMVSM